MNDSEIGYEQARKMALNVATERLRRFNPDNLPPLQEEFIEGKHFWMFFRNRNIFGKEHEILSWDGSYMIIKKNGKQFGPPDYFNDKEKLEEYIKFLDENIPERGW